VKGTRTLVTGLVLVLLVATGGYIGTRSADADTPIVAIGPVQAPPPGESLPVLGASSTTPARALPRTPRIRSGETSSALEIRVDGDREIFLPLESVFVLPADSVRIEVVGRGPGEVAIDAGGGTLDEVDAGRWTWKPSFESGYADLTMRDVRDDRTFLLRAWRLVPRSEIRDGRIGSYRVGRYPGTPLRGNPIYLPPPGLVEVTDANRDVRVSPRFRIGQFISKQSTSLPSYLILRTQLLLKLEVVLDALIDRGYQASAFHVMSGYRTPYYNVSVLGNVQYSRHQWGGAADVFVDEAPRNGYMDDLNGDGKIGLRDIRIITSVVDSLERELESLPIGGAGVYRANTVRGPFVHLDVRGQPARW